MMPAGHDEAFVALGALAIDAVDAAERTALDAHVAGCEICRTEIDLLRGAAANLAFAAPLAADSATHSRARIRERLSSRATSEAQARRLAKPPLVFPKTTDGDGPARPRAAANRPAPRWSVIAAGVLFVSSVGLLALTWRERDELRGTLASQNSTSDRSRIVTDSLVAALASRDSLITGLMGRDVTVLTLTPRAARDAYARLYWDRTHNSWTLFARNMPTLKPGRTYQVWIVTNKATVSAGTFVVNHGAGFIRATFAVAPDNLRAVAITEEPAGGGPEPTGDTMIAVSTR